MPKFEKFLNETMPANGEYKKLVVNLSSDGKSFDIFIIEINGTEVNINDTSLGRRWLLTYWFIKNNLSKGDFLLIDEPGDFLHPQAQKRLLLDIENLILEKECNVVLTTHSPYMISEKIDSYYYVSITEKGTAINKYHIEDFRETREKLGILEFNNTVLDGFILASDKTYLFVEGYTDEVCFEVFMKLLKINKEKYKIVTMEGCKNLDIYYKIIYKCEFKYMFLIDADTKMKFKYLLDKVPNDKIIFVANKINCSADDKMLERLFAPIDQEKYFNRGGKVNANKIKNVMLLEHFSPETIRNFEDLFKEANIIRSTSKVI